MSDVGFQGALQAAGARMLPKFHHLQAGSRKHPAGPAVDWRIVLLCLAIIAARAESLSRADVVRGS